MVSLIKLITILLIISSCAKFNYLIKQGKGQYFLLSEGIENNKVLNDPSISAEFKTKITLIEKYKKYFYQYWKKEESDIYSETVFLKDKAVTYLVIASLQTEIVPKNECFPFMGCFPYLGFFSKDDAEKYAEKLKKEDYATYIRPVYAYSTLGMFDDNILSSFFYYDEFELAELVFHELFHTIFFVKGEVDLNENMANFFGKEMAKEYFQDKSESYLSHLSDLNKQEKLSQKLVEIVQNLNREYKNKKPSISEASQILSSFKKEKLYPQIIEECKKLKVEKCYLAKRDWNNASLAAFLTYEKSVDHLKKLKEEEKMDLQALLAYIESKYKDYRKEGRKATFEEVLFLNK